MLLRTSRHDAEVGRSCHTTELKGGSCPSGAASRTSQSLVFVHLDTCREIDYASYIVLIIRVLYRLRFLSEQATFDVATFSYAYPLFGQVLSQGGIAVEEVDEALEQVALALGIIKFHCGECV